MEREDLYWKAVAAGAGMVASLAARGVATAVWRAARHEDPPADPDNPSITWGEAIAWAALTGITVGVAELLARRFAANTWVRSQYTTPPAIAREPDRRG